MEVELVEALENLEKQLLELDCHTVYQYAQFTGCIGPVSDRSSIKCISNLDINANPILKRGKLFARLMQALAGC